MSLDAIDLRILRHLQQDGRMSNQDLAEKVSGACRDKGEIHSFGL